MQEKLFRRSNRARTQSTRASLITAARRLFVEKSYAATGTPEIAEAAGVTRGALYHHFADKEDLLRAVIEQEAAAVAAEVEHASADADDPLGALMSGGRAYLAAMRDTGRTHLMLLDGPAVLGRTEADRIDSLHGGRSLREGLRHAIATGAFQNLPLQPLSEILSAAFDRAALSIALGSREDEHIEVLEALLGGLTNANKVTGKMING